MKILVKIIFYIALFNALNIHNTSAEEKIKIGLLVPLTGPDKEMGDSIIKSVRMAINKIDNPLIEILPKDTGSNPQLTLINAKNLKKNGVKIIIGPVFNKNLIYLDQVKDVIFLSLTNKIIDNPKNIISAGINASSQFKTIIQLQKINKLNKSIILIPKENYKNEIERVIKKTKIKHIGIHYYDSDPTKLTNQIEKITRYNQRKRNLQDEIYRLENSNENNKEKKIEKLEKRDTLGGVKFDSIIISDFDENLKSITTSLLYTDISPEKFYFIALNQWFDKSLLNETSSQSIYFPSINKNNYDQFIKDYNNEFNEYPNQLSFLSYDLVGLVYYLIIKNNHTINEDIFYKKNMFKGKVGIFEIKDNKINHILNFYKVEDGRFKKIF